MAGLAVVLAGAASVVIAPAVPATAAVTATKVAKCPTVRGHWYGGAWTGTGESIGTEVNTIMPSSFYAPHNTTTDEAAWIYDPKTPKRNAIELGWFQGLWPYPGRGYGHNFRYAQGYDTFNNGAYGAILTGRLPANEMQFKIADVGGTGTALQISDIKTGRFYYAANILYNVHGPRVNLSQGEVANGGKGAWMGGNHGRGEISYGLYEPRNSQNFRRWGSFSMCDNSPYWIRRLGHNEWKNGGK